MSNQAKSTQGSTLGVSTSPTGPFTDVARITSIPRGTGSAQWLDVTNFASQGTKEYIPGLADISDVNITGQRVVDDAGQNILRDACHAIPKTTLYFQSKSAQGEVFNFTSEVATWALAGDPNATETFTAGIRPRDEKYTAPDGTSGGSTT